jgi:phosphatidylglycerophosphatase A
MGNNILNVFGLGKLPFSASLASLLVLPVYWGISRYCPFPLAVNGAFFFLVLAWSMALCSRHAAYAIEDPKEIVVDEVLGMHITLILANSGSYYAIAILFLLFRIFDIFKIFPFNVIEKKLRGKYGVLWDDIAIGIFLGAAFFAVNKYAGLNV